MKKKQFFIVWIVLVLLTISSSVVSHTVSKFGIALIIGFAAIKFFGISFYFMELKKAHAFWKVSILIFVLLFSTITLMLI